MPVRKELRLVLSYFVIVASAFMAINGGSFSTEISITTILIIILLKEFSSGTQMLSAGLAELTYLLITKNYSIALYGFVMYAGIGLASGLMQKTKISRYAQIIILCFIGFFLRELLVVCTFGWQTAKVAIPLKLIEFTVNTLIGFVLNYIILRNEKG